MPSGRVEPFFVRFANGDTTVQDVISSVVTSDHESTAAIAKRAMENPPDMSQFKVDFKNMLGDLVDNGVSRRVVNYVDSYMKPSLEEFVESIQGGRAGESRWVAIKAEDAPWPEALVCYNLCLYLKMYGVRELKRCPICQKFFSHKGKYAKYCSDNCKQAGSR